MGDSADLEDASIVGRWYADTFRVGQNAFEFKVDCGHDAADGDMRTIYLRVIANPANARELFRQLGVGLLRYADVFGPIEDDGQPPLEGSGP